VLDARATVAAAALVLQATILDAAPPAREHSLNEGWRFLRGEAPGAERPEFDDKGWRPLDVPHDWSIEDLPSTDGRSPTGPFDEKGSAGGRDTGWVVGGTGWYRNTFRAPSVPPGGRVEVIFDGIAVESDVWLNGRHLGQHRYAYTPSAYDLTPHLRPDGTNVLAVQVRNPGKNSRWYTGSGIYRDVRLTVTGPVRIPRWGVVVTTPEVARDRARVAVSVDLVNGSAEAREIATRVRLLGADDAAVAEGTTERFRLVPKAGRTVALSLEVARPRLWSPDAPGLHRAVVDLLARDGDVVDRVEVPFGIRKVEIDARQGLRLNGERLSLRGGCVHHDNGPLGAVALARAEERRVELLKAAGFNAVRTAHNPPSPAFLDACDRLGMLVIDEAFDMWQVPKRPDDYSRHFELWSARDLAAMVRRDRNHPSVVFWSIGNEIEERADPAGVEIGRRLAASVRALDATRPVTAGICGFWEFKDRPWSDSPPAFVPLDVGGYNYEWRQYETDHALFPDRVMVGTESFPSEAFESWEPVEKHPWVIGDFVWTALDYLGESGLGRTWIEGRDSGEDVAPWPWHIAGSGDIDILGGRKPWSYYREALWRPGVLHVAVKAPLEPGQIERVTRWGWPDVRSHWTWPGAAGRTLSVDVYSSHEKVTLRLDGKTIGSASTGRAERHRARFEVPYRPGALVAIGETQGQVPATVTLRTAGPPARLRLLPDRTSIRASGDDLSFVSIEVADAEGTRVPDAAHRIRVALTGKGELAALANGDPRSTAGFRGSERDAWRGGALAIVRPTGPGEIRVRVEAEGLSPAEVSIVARPDGRPGEALVSR
jgi:beta-galactosidase